MASFIFGEPDLFSINVFFSDEYTMDGFANFSMCCGGCEVGDRESYVSIDAIKSQFANKINSYDHTLAKKMRFLDKKDVVLYLTEHYENSANWKQSESISSIWLSLDLSPSMDGDIVIWLLSPEHDRIIWKFFNKNIISEIFLPSGYALDKIEDFMKTN